MVPTGVVGVIAVGVDGRAVRSAKAMVPFLARFTGHGVVPGDGNPLIVRFKVPVPLPHSFDCGQRDRERSGVSRYAGDVSVGCVYG